MKTDKIAIAAIGVFLLMSSPLFSMTEDSSSASIADPYAAYRAAWAKEAEKAKPELIETLYRPLYLVKGERDSTAYQGWRMVKSGEMSDYYGVSLKQRQCVTVDFGKHLTGYFSFRINVLHSFPVWDLLQNVSKKRTNKFHQIISGKYG